MAKKHNIIEINGRRYDAGTGTPLDAGHPGHSQAKQPKPVSIPVHVVKSRGGAKNLHSHAPQPAKTLMRQAVSKPQIAAKTIRIKTVSQVDLPNKSLAIIAKPSVSRLDEARLHHANHIKRSHLISRFNRRQMWAGSDFVATEASTAVSSTPIVQASQAAKKAATHKPRTTADILDMAIQNATSHLQPPVKPERHHRVWRRHHAHAH